MQRSKQQAMMFLLGAVLVGGALGFSADRVYQRWGREKHQRPSWNRTAMFDDLGFTTEQRTAYEAVADSTSCRLRNVMIQMAPLQAQFDSIRRSSRRQLDAIMTTDQRAIWEQREQQFRSRGGPGGPSRGGPPGPGGRGGPGPQPSSRPPSTLTPQQQQRDALCKAMFPAKEPQKP